jgi:four helix bundle protein
MKDFRKLEVWERAYMLNWSVYDLRWECSGLVRAGVAPQMQRESTAIASNIARGCGSSGNDGAQPWHFNNAMGAAASLDYLVYLAFELGLISDDYYEWFHQMTVDIQGMLRSMMAKETRESRSQASLTLVQ